MALADKLIGELPRKRGEKLVVRIVEWKQKRYADIRLWFLDVEGDWRPTRQGLRVNTHDWPQLVQLLAKVQAQLGPAPTNGQPAKAGKG
jgi:Transcriptional Coactivator p15 (PC4)